MTVSSALRPILTFAFADVVFFVFQNYNKDSVEYVQQHLTKNEVPTDLFEVRLSYNHTALHFSIECVAFSWF